MLLRLRRTTFALAVLASTLAWPAGSANAQPAPNRAPAPPAAPRTIAMGVDDPNADRTRDQLMELLDRYPPSVGRVLKLDPSLLENPDYLATYPSLGTFVAQHPDVSRNPTFYFERVHIPLEPIDTRSDAYRIVDNLMGWLGGLGAATLVVFSLGWLVRTLVDYRRWYRLSKVQAEAHTKLLDRMTANEELLAYVQSPAGSRFLESAPIALEPGTRRVGAPFSRILWSAQAGVVVTAAGLGMRYMGRQIGGDAVAVFSGLGTLVVAIGLGLLISCAVSFVLSRRLGLLERGDETAS